MITIYLISNFVSIHQYELCKAFLHKKDVDFKFVSCFGPSGFKKDLSNFEQEDFVVRMYDNTFDKSLIIRKINDADIVIFGSGDPKLISTREKPIFRYSEHFSRNKFLFPFKAIHIHKLYKREDKNGGYLLCASSHSKKDFNFANLYRNKCLYYGYFPPIVSDDKIVSKIKCRETINILWAGRGLALKHPEFAFLAAKVLKKEQANFKITICASQTNFFKRLTEKNKKKPWMENVVILPPQTHEKILDMMINNDIFLFTSDNKEGWGAVLNEAMSAKCACLCNCLAGSTNFLIQDGDNGFIYKTKKEFVTKIKKMVKNPIMISNMGENARITVTEKWSASIAVENLLKFYKCLNQNIEFSDSEINNGPCTLIK